MKTALMMAPPARLLTVFLTGMLLAAPLLSCAPEDTPEQIAEAFVSRASTAFKQRSVRQLRALVSAAYSDSANRGRDEVVAIGATYLRRSKSIHLFTRLDSATLSGERVQAKALVAFAARPVDDPSLLGRIEADIYWFDFSLGPDGRDWKLMSAAWRQAMVSDVIPP